MMDTIALADDGHNFGTAVQ